MSFIFVLLAIFTAINNDNHILAILNPTFSSFEICVFWLLLAIYWEIRMKSKEYHCPIVLYNQYDTNNNRSSDNREMDSINIELPNPDCCYILCKEYNYDCLRCPLQK